jgi:hypothetical protein
VAKKKHVAKVKTLLIDKLAVAQAGQKNLTWEADFRRIPNRLINASSQYHGWVISTENGAVLAETQIDGKPSPVQLAALLSEAILRPRTGTLQRPRHLHIQGESKWRKLLPELSDLGIEVTVRSDLPQLRKVHNALLDQVRESKREQMVVPNSDQATIERLFPAIARWVQGGTIEIGKDEEFGFIVRALDAGGVVFENDGPETLAEAMAALEAGLKRWFQENDP